MLLGILLRLLIILCFLLFLFFKHQKYSCREQFMPSNCPFVHEARNNLRLCVIL